MNTDDRYIFVLGDSRTGTLSLSNYFLRHGIPSIHYFVDQSGAEHPLDELREEKVIKCLDFIKNSAYRCFSDYPTRSFYKEIAQAFPNAFYILSVRKDTATWQRSMINYFSKFSMKLDIEKLSLDYENGNADIRSFFSNDTYSFIEICIDDDASKNSEKLANFLSFSGTIKLTKDNASTDVDTRILSHRAKLYSLENLDIISELGMICAPGKCLISESGWTFLINDTNDFLRFQFGEKNWALSDIKNAKNSIFKRNQYLALVNSKYFKFIVPEKSVIYREFLPKTLSGLLVSEQRPAHLLSTEFPSFVHYLFNYLQDAKSYGLLYFRGDSHTNWLGAWFVYYYIANLLCSEGYSICQQPLKFADLIPSVASYDGDLFVQLNDTVLNNYRCTWGNLLGKDGFEVTVQYQLAESNRKAWRIDTPLEYQMWFSNRETIVYERPDKAGLKAVIFRDSTADLCLDFIAQHFARSVFIWHQGLVYLEVIEREQPDVVLHIMAERFVTMYKNFPSISTIGNVPF